MAGIRYCCLLCVLTAVAAVGCDSLGCAGADSSGASETSPLTNEKAIDFTVDGKGVRYLYRTGYGGARSKLRLEDVPLAYRGAVSVHVTGKTGDAKAGQQAYLAELTEAEPGDEVKAYLHNQDFFVAASRAGIDAGRAAVGVGQLAQELAEMTPGSEFREHMTTTIVLEDKKTGKVERKQVQVKRARPKPDKPDEPEEKSLWERAFGSESEEEADRGEESAWREVVMYSTPWCPACKVAKRWLREQGVPFEVKDVSTSTQARQEMQRYCSQNGLQPTAVPTFRIGSDNKMLQGWHAGRFERLARK